MQSLSTSVRYALRRLRRSPGFASVMVLTLAVGIGLNTAIFTVVDNVLLRPLGYEDADRIVALQTHFDEENRSIPRLGGDDYNDPRVGRHRALRQLRRGDQSCRQVLVCPDRRREPGILAGDRGETGGWTSVSCRGSCRNGRSGRGRVCA